MISGGFYWSNFVEDLAGEDLSPDNVPQEFLERVTSRIGHKIPFYVVDIARKADGGWVVIELNDGQMSGLSENDPRVLYKNLRELMDTAKDQVMAERT